MIAQIFQGWKHIYQHKKYKRIEKWNSNIALTHHKSKLLAKTFLGLKNSLDSRKNLEYYDKYLIDTKSNNHFTVCTKSCKKKRFRNCTLIKNTPIY